MVKLQPRPKKKMTSDEGARPNASEARMEKENERDRHIEIVGQIGGVAEIERVGQFRLVGQNDESLRPKWFLKKMKKKI